MKVLMQKVSHASVTVEGSAIGSIDRGYLLYLGVVKGDTEEQARWIAQKISSLRLFDGEDGKINDRSLADIGGDALVVSQFTLAGSTEKGNRPDYTQAEAPAEAKRLYEFFGDCLRDCGVRKVETGQFGAHMEVESLNDGPVTLYIER